MATPNKPIVLYDNKLSTYGFVTVTSELSGYPKENTYDWRYFTKWQSTSSATQDFIIDLGAATICDSFAVMNHNLGTRGATLAVGTDTASAFPSVTTIGTNTFTDDNPKYISLTSSSERYYRIRISGGTGAYACGMFFLGNKYTMPVLPQDGFDPDEQQAFFKVNTAITGHAVGSSVTHTDRMQKLSMRYVSEAQAQTFKDFYEDHASLGKPFFYLPDITNYSTRIYLMRCPNNYALSMPSEGVYRHLNLECQGIRDVKW